MASILSMFIHENCIVPTARVDAMETVQCFKICSMPSSAPPKRMAEVELNCETPFCQFPRTCLAAKKKKKEKALAGIPSWTVPPQQVAIICRPVLYLFSLLAHVYVFPQT
jgi:hypothetical protein